MLRVRVQTKAVSRGVERENPPVCMPTPAILEDALAADRRTPIIAGFPEISAVSPPAAGIAQLRV